MSSRVGRRGSGFGGGGGAAGAYAMIRSATDPRVGIEIGVAKADPSWTFTIQPDPSDDGIIGVDEDRKLVSIGYQRYDVGEPVGPSVLDLILEIERHGRPREVTSIVRVGSPADRTRVEDPDPDTGQITRSFYREPLVQVALEEEAGGGIPAAFLAERGLGNNDLRDRHWRGLFIGLQRADAGPDWVLDRVQRGTAVVAAAAVVPQSGDPATTLTFTLPSSIAEGADGNDWTLTLVQGTSFAISLDNAAKEVTVRYVRAGATFATVAAAINGVYAGSAVAAGTTATPFGAVTPRQFSGGTSIEDIHARIDVAAKIVAIYYDNATDTQMQVRDALDGFEIDEDTTLFAKELGGSDLSLRPEGMGGDDRPFDLFYSEGSLPKPEPPAPQTISGSLSPEELRLQLDPGNTITLPVPAALREQNTDTNTFSVSIRAAGTKAQLDALDVSAPATMFLARPGSEYDLDSGTSVSPGDILLYTGATWIRLSEEILDTFTGTHVLDVDALDSLLASYPALPERHVVWLKITSDFSGDVYGNNYDFEAGELWVNDTSRFQWVRLRAAPSTSSGGSDADGEKVTNNLVDAVTATGTTLAGLLAAARANWDDASFMTVRMTTRLLQRVLKAATTTVRGVVLLARAEDVAATETDTSRVLTVATGKELIQRLSGGGPVQTQHIRAGWSADQAISDAELSASSATSTVVLPDTASGLNYLAIWRSDADGGDPSEVHLAGGGNSRNLFGAAANRTYGGVDGKLIVSVNRQNADLLGGENARLV